MSFNDHLEDPFDDFFDGLEETSEETDNDKSVKTCPFCGSNAIIREEDCFFRIGCPEEQCLGNACLDYIYESKKLSIQEWNKRSKSIITSAGGEDHLGRELIPLSGYNAVRGMKVIFNPPDGAIYENCLEEGKIYTLLKFIAKYEKPYNSGCRKIVKLEEFMGEFIGEYFFAFKGREEESEDDLPF